MNNNNGFLEALEQINTLMNVNQQVSMDALEEAANYFVEKLRSKIPRSKFSKKHLRDALKVVVQKDMVQVVFDDWAGYWHLVEHGHKSVRGKKVKGKHFVRNTFDSESEKISNIMLEKIIRKMEGQ
ncbi:phage protein, HK97 gp10 family [Schinkia azotoformans MEV2011]|uniref:Phage protein, HK97 gp10 family n=1 Tax=Schinkia azotoformans MEV2011 TaxID=1348973 RepID=A0A072NRR4_SCHAZ|nr:HK97-gp10 family putative phage morphogenesis protein [Schinkia azotoformans]KEF40116.1 phage protein, HK97 gp10 family [Schinkia azotoformans MEV2011]